MPELAPFTGLRPQPAVTGPLEDVICPPYDVISEAQRAELVARSPYNVVRVELPNGDYRGAAQLLAGWEQEGALAREPSPALYGYAMSYDGPSGARHRTVGVIGALALEPPGRGILPHEQTTPKAKSDRLELIRATRANTSPIWCLCPQAGLTEAIGAPPASSTALVGAYGDDGARHEIWPITDRATQQQVSKVVDASPVLVADGHHRYETALAYQAEPGHAPGADAVMALVVELSEEHLEVLAIHRALSGLPARFDLPAALEAHFELRPTGADGPHLLQAMVQAGGLGLVTSSGTWLAVPKVAGPADGPGLDSSRADLALASLPAHQLAYDHDVAQMVEGVRSGRLDAALLCRPATVAQIAQTAQGGQRMPPKTTFFWPKPRTGLVFRTL